MPRLAEFVRRLSMLFRGRQADRDLDEEMRLHIELRAEDRMKAGAAREDARHAAHRRFGNTTLLRERGHDMWGWSWLESLVQDVRYGARTMWRSPGVTIVAMLSLALGIGANTGVFSLMDALMLRALPVERPSELVLFGDGRAAGDTDDFPNGDTRLFSYPFYLEAQKDSRVLSGLTAILSLPLGEHGTVAESHGIESVNAELVSGTYFSVLGVRPALGRVLTDADDDTPGGHPVAVASDAWWRRRFDRDPAIVGKTVTIRSTAYTIVGVAPPDFFGTTVGNSPDLWMPLSMAAQVSPGWPGDLKDNLYQSLYLIGRLAPNVSAAQAETDVNRIFKQALTTYAGSAPSGHRLDDIQHAHIQLTSAARGLSRLRRQFSEPLQILLAIVGLVLLIACVNIANLLLARSTARSREIAVRQALGARRLRLVRQLLTESLLLALGGGALGLVFAVWASHLLLRLASGGPDPLPIHVAIDARLLTFTAAVACATAILFGIVPALRATRSRFTTALKEGRGPVGADTRSPLAKALVVSQVAISVVLLVGAGLFLRSLINLTHVDTGFNKDHVLRLSVDASSAGYGEDARLEDLYQQIEARVAALPGVRADSFSEFTFNEGEWTDDVTIEGYTPPPDVRQHPSHNVVGAGYFAAMGIPVIVGRAFGPQDTATSPRVAVINETMARTLFPAGSPIGRRFSIDGVPPVKDIEVIGVVKDAKYESLNEMPRPADYLPHAQHLRYLGDFEARVTGDPASIVPDVRRVIGEIDASLPISGVTTLAAQVDGSVARERLVADLSAFFGFLALGLTCIGIYGVMTYAVTRRTNEIGIRMALGTARPTVLWLVMRESFLLVALGIVVGLPVSLALGHLVASMLFSLSATDSVTLVVAPVVLLIVAMVACLLPARRASKVDPMVALRHE